MTSLSQFYAIAASRGDGLHPKLRELFEHTAASPPSAVTIREDGLLQAGPNPDSEEVASRVDVTLFPCDSTCPAAVEHEPEARQFRKQVR
jgi:hypothetical protein